MPKIELIYDDPNQNYFLREAYKTARTNFMFSGSGIKTVIVTSCQMSEGKSTVSLNLALSLAEFGKRVLLLDADLRKSIMANHIDAPLEKGFSHFLSGQAEWNEVVCQTQFEKLDVVFSGKTPPNPVELIGSDRMKRCLEDAREEYDYILIDSPPLGMVIDSAVLAPFCDGAILVLDTGRIPAREAQRVKAQLEKSGCRLLGVILNHTQKAKKFPALLSKRKSKK